MKFLGKKIFSILLAMIICIVTLPICGFAAVSDYPVFSINILEETGTTAVVSVNLDSGSFEYVTFYLIPNNNIVSCNSIDKSEEFAETVETLENNSETVMFVNNPDSAMVTIASTHTFTETGSYFEFTLTKETEDKLTKSDLTVSISDIAATYKNNLPLGYGDVNGDGKINLADALLILKYCNGSEKLDESDFYWADVNRDSVVDSQDAALTEKYYAGDIDKFSSSLKIENDSPVFSLSTLYENETEAVFSVGLTSGSFSNGTFYFSINKEYESATVCRSDCFNKLGVEISDNGGYTLFNANGLTASVASTTALMNTDDYILLKITKSENVEFTAEDITLDIKDIDATVENNIAPNECEHSFVTVITDATCSAEGKICEQCSKCKYIKNEIALPKLLKSAVISGEYLTGIDRGTSVEKFISDNFYSTTATIKIDNTYNNLVCTGTTVTTQNYNNVVEKYIAVIYGDVNCDGFDDGMDAVIVKCLVSGMLNENDFTEFTYTAADCNQDKIIDKTDAEILENAGLKGRL